jgi:seryl-tRNA(Sec) selenium transferase
MNDNEKNVVTLKLRFHKDRDEEYSVYRFLKSSGQSVTKTVISCVDVYRNIQSEHEREERFINRVEEVIQDNLKALIPLMKLLSITQSIAVPVQPQEAEFNSISEEDKIGQMQDFLNSFEEDDSDTEERQE